MKNTELKITIVVIALLGLAGGWLFFLRKGDSEKPKSDATYRVRKEIYENIIEVSGTVSAAAEKKLQALGAGTVLGVYVKEGDAVKKGDIIMQLDATDQIYNLEKHDYETASKQISGSQRELALRKTERRALVQKVNDRKVIATFDGVIAALNVAVGDSLEAKDQIGTLVNLDYLTTEVEVSETDVAKLKVGQEVDFTFSAFKNETVKGYVVGWPAIGEITNRGATIVKVKIRIDDYPKTILPNYSFTGKIVLSQPDENFVVERYAIGYEGKNAFVVLAQTGEKKYVRVRNYGKEYVKIVEGLNREEILTAQTAPPVSGTKRNRQERNDGGNGGGTNGMGRPPQR